MLFSGRFPRGYRKCPSPRTPEWWLWTGTRVLTYFCRPSSPATFRATQGAEKQHCCHAHVQDEDRKQKDTFLSVPLGSRFTSPSRLKPNQVQLASAGHCSPGLARTFPTQFPRDQMCSPDTALGLPTSVPSSEIVVYKQPGWDSHCSWPTLSLYKLSRCHQCFALITDLGR